MADELDEVKGEVNFADLVKQVALLTEHFTKMAEAQTIILKSVSNNATMIRGLLQRLDEIDKRVHTLDAQTADLYDRATLRERDPSTFLENQE